MDASIDTPHGPRTIQKTGNVSIPKDLQAEVGIGPGKQIHWILNPDMLGTLVLVPSTMMNLAMPELMRRLREVGR